ncbi:hypothetical protein FRC01_008205 [Tulasnella sp. 417]|nr:hypothetical protein FRC01_008205 [Tulasnella sp. 417]
MFCGNASLIGQYSDFIPCGSGSNQFLDVAAKVTSVRLDKTLVNNLIKALLEVGKSIPGRILFPALSALDCGGIPQDDLVTSLFAGSPIKTIAISGGDWGKTAPESRMLISKLFATQSQVQFLAADELTTPGLGSPEFWLLPGLRSLAYKGHLTFGDWANLIQNCPDLDSIAFEGSALGSNLPSPAPLHAPSLRRLDLTAFESPDIVLFILESTNAPQLTALDLFLDLEPEHTAVEHPSTSRLRAAFRVLSERGCCLESLALGTSINLGGETLAAFRRLKSLDIRDWTSSCQLDDGDIDLLCHSLTELRRFYLEYNLFRSASTVYANITPRSFGSFARHCTELTYLGLPVTAANPDDFIDTSFTELVPFRNNLRDLALTPLTLFVDKTNDFVSFLLVQCPNLGRLDIHLNAAHSWPSVSTLTRIERDMTIDYFQRRLQ